MPNFSPVATGSGLVEDKSAPGAVIVEAVQVGGRSLELRCLLPETDEDGSTLTGLVAARGRLSKDNGNGNPFDGLTGEQFASVESERVADINLGEADAGGIRSIRFDGLDTGVYFYGVVVADAPFTASALPDPEV